VRQRAASSCFLRLGSSPNALSHPDQGPCITGILPLAYSSHTRWRLSWREDRLARTLPSPQTWCLVCRLANDTADLTGTQRLAFLHVRPARPVKTSKPCELLFLLCTATRLRGKNSPFSGRAAIHKRWKTTNHQRVEDDREVVLPLPLAAKTWYASDDEQAREKSSATHASATHSVGGGSRRNRRYAISLANRASLEQSYQGCTRTHFSHPTMGPPAISDFSNRAPHDVNHAVDLYTCHSYAVTEH
jgi:hypothetical protein